MIWLRLAATAFGGAKLVTKIILLTSAAGIVVTAYGVWHHKVYSKGYEAAIAAIARADDKAVSRARALRSKVKECQELGRKWDQSNGTCASR